MLASCLPESIVLLQFMAVSITSSAPPREIDTDVAKMYFQWGPKTTARKERMSQRSCKVGKTLALKASWL